VVLRAHTHAPAPAQGTVQSELPPACRSISAPRRQAGAVQSTIAPAVAKVLPSTKLGITELRLAAHKSPVCVVLCEEMHSQRPFTPSSPSEGADSSGSGAHNSGPQLVTEMHAVAGRQGDPFAEADTIVEDTAAAQAGVTPPEGGGLPG